MKPKILESILFSLDEFEKPNIALEQYITQPHVAAYMLNIIGNENGDIEGKLVGDLGCGCGHLSIGAALMDAGAVIGFDIDSNALEIAERNKEDVECDNLDFIQCDVQDLENSRWKKKFDTIIMNPPFGTKNSKGIDMTFLKTALSLSTDVVYSLHKSTTFEHIKKIVPFWNVMVQPLYKLKFDLPQTYSRHKKATCDIEVHLLRFTFINNKKS